MEVGLIRYSCMVVLLVTSIVFASDDPVFQPLPVTNPAANITNAVTVVIAPTNNSPVVEVLPNVERGTNTAISVEAYERKLADARRKWKAATNNLGIYHLIPERNPFGLIKPEIKKPESKIISKTNAVVVPHLAGISMLRNNMRAVLRISPRGKGSTEYKFISVGEMVDGVEVLKIDPKEGVVKVKVKNQTHTLELDKNTLANFKSIERSSGSNHRLTNKSSRLLGISSSNKGTLDRETQEETRKGGDSGTSSKKPSGSSNGELKPVPSRSRSKKSNLGMIRPIDSGLYELPAFNEVVQKRIIDPLNISTQREIIRGQLSYETPTDLPGDKR